MTTLKDILDATNSTDESAASSTARRPKTDAGHLRSDAVSLEVPVKVHGSRVVEVVRGATPHTEPFEEQSATMIVFPQGGVLRMATAVGTGQAVVITNLKSRQDAICRVQKVRACGEKQYYVEIEFTNPQPGYWGVYFPGDGGRKAAPAPVPPPAAKPSEPKVEIHARSTPTPDVSWAPPPAPKPASEPPSVQARAPRKESAFAQIDTREEVQPPAAATVGDPFAARSKTRTGEGVKKEAPPTSVPSLSMTEQPGDGFNGPAIAEEVTVPSAKESSSDHSAATFGRFAASARLGGDTASAMTAESPRPGGKGLLIATCLAGALAIAAGIAFYLRNRPFAHSAAPPESPAPIAQTAMPSAGVASNSVPSNVAPPSLPQVNAGLSASAPSVSAPMVAPPAVHASEVAPAKSSRESVAELSQPAAPVNQKAATPAPMATRRIISALNAHPISPKRTNGSGAGDDLSLDASSITTNPGSTLSGAGAPAVIAPPPPVAQNPSWVGGEVKQPKLIYAPAPVYPSIARQAGIEGTVLVEATVQADGKLTGAKVVSGPEMLRQAALDAVLRRKYEPGTLNGHPTSLQVSVAIQFRR